MNRRWLVLLLLLFAIACGRSEPKATTKAIDEADLAAHLDAIDAKIGLTWPPSPAPDPAPAPSPAIYDLQGAISGATAGSTIHVPSGTCKSRISVSKNLSIVFDAPFVLDASGFSVPLSQGAFTIKGASVNVSGPLRITGSSGAALDFINAHDCTVSGLELDHNAQQGYHAYQSQRITLKRLHVHHNNPDYKVDVNVEAGAGKLWNCDTVTFDGCEIDHNGGHGIWFDSGSAGNSGNVVQNCRVHHNGRAGILFEVSGGTNRATKNYVWENGWYKKGDRGWCGGIVSSTSCGSEIDGNLLAWNQEGIIVGGQHRNDFPVNVTGNYVHDNTVCMWPQSRTGTRYGLDWYGPAGDAMFSAAANNRGADNRFAWHGTPATGYSWNGADLGLAAFSATAGGQGSTALADADTTPVLSAAGIPMTAETH